MDYPVIFPLFVPLKHKGPDTVRKLLKSQSFIRCPSETTELWEKLCGRGFAVVRIDSQGHDQIGPRGLPHHGRVPHYHKEWIAFELHDQYIRGQVRQVVRYDDAGIPVTGQMTDGKAKATHIKR
jgi:hypothetical protein